MTTTFDFPYYVLYRQIGDQYRPIINAEFAMGEDIFSKAMLVDTGASGVLLPASAAELLGIELPDLPVLGGQTFYGAEREVKLGPKIQVSLPDIAEDMHFTVDVCFADWIEHWSFGLLGRDVLDHLRCCFTHEQGLQFYLGLR